MAVRISDMPTRADLSDALSGIKCSATERVAAWGISRAHADRAMRVNRERLIILVSSCAVQDRLHSQRNAFQAQGALSARGYTVVAVARKVRTKTIAGFAGLSVTDARPPNTRTKEEFIPLLGTLFATLLQARSRDPSGSYETSYLGVR